MRAHSRFDFNDVLQVACEVYFAKIETHLKGTSEDTRHLTRLLEMADVRKMARWTMGGIRTPMLLPEVAYVNAKEPFTNVKAPHSS